MKLRTINKPVILVLLTALLFVAFSMTALAESVFIQAETGKQDTAAPMKTGTGLNSFGTGYIFGEENGIEKISYEFELQEAGDYYIWLRIMGQDDTSNSYFVKVDGKGFDPATGDTADTYYTFDMWEPSEGYEYSASNPFLPTLEQHKDPLWIYNPNWHWIPLAYRDQTIDPPIRHNILKINFAAGKHTIDVMTREPNAYLDEIIITNDLSYDPRGIAGDPEAIYLAEKKAAEDAAAAAAAADVPAAAEKPAAAKNPKTADPITLSVILLAVSGAAFGYAKKRR